ncbi:MAG: hypothetical protein QY328_12490 [Anaerolineales bacterium]|nr:MAG: hypothetical protein QY328_12490 [Anaerolineales bacterium]
MSSSDFFTGLSVILAAMSLIATVIGWTITYKRQKEILERQISANLEKEKISLLINMTLSEIEKVRNWINKGFRIVRLIENIKSDKDKAELIEIEKAWDVEGNEILHTCFYLDKKSKTTHLRHKEDYLENFVHIFSRGVSLEFRKVVLGEKIETNDFDLDAGFNALDRIDILTRETLGQPIPNYHSIYET